MVPIDERGGAREVRIVGTGPSESLEPPHQSTGEFRLATFSAPFSKTTEARGAAEFYDEAWYQVKGEHRWIDRVMSNLM